MLTISDFIEYIFSIIERLSIIGKDRCNKKNNKYQMVGVTVTYFDEVNNREINDTRYFRLWRKL